MRAIAILSMHTSPLAQPGTGDGGGMNVYVRELSSALARQGVRCEVFTRADDPSRPATVNVEPGFKVHHLPAGPLGPVPKEQLPDLVNEWTGQVGSRLTALAASGQGVDAIHANYWLSGQAGHALKHQLDIPLISTFHTLDRVKAEASVEEILSAEPARRERAEIEVVGCSDVVLASCSVEAEQLVKLYDADPERIEIVPPAVDHAFFAPGDRRQARRAIGFTEADPMILFVGRIQPLKGLTVAVEALAQMRKAAGGRLQRATLVVVGGPSGPHGQSELDRVHDLATRLGVPIVGLQSTERDDHCGGIRFVAPQRHEILSTYYRAADACVMPSRSESFGLVALEAGACGLPVVAAAVGGLTTLVDHGVTGFLVEGSDPGDYARHTAALLLAPHRAGEIGRAAAARARCYTWPAAADRLRERASQLLSRELVACR